MQAGIAYDMTAQGAHLFDGEYEDFWRYLRGVIHRGRVMVQF